MERATRNRMSAGAMPVLRVFCLGVAVHASAARCESTVTCAHTSYRPAAQHHASVAQCAGTFTATGEMTAARSGHTATLLADSRVLIAGGWSGGDVLASAELYDPATGTFAPAGDMTTARAGHTATLLADGRVLIAGGWSGGDILASAELYDPAMGTFSATGDMVMPQSSHRTILLRNGEALIVGTGDAAQLYDPDSGTFRVTVTYRNLLGLQTATLLADGRVLVTGCAFECGTGWSELYDPDAGTFSLTGTMSAWGQSSTATLLMNGKVLFVSDAAAWDYYGEPPEEEVYDPPTGAFAPVGNTMALRLGHSATLLPDGAVLIAGGDASAELYDPATGTFAFAGRMTRARTDHTATLLTDGTVLIAGGYGWNALTSAEIYRPPVAQVGPFLFSLSRDGRGQGAILHPGTPYFASPSYPAEVGEALEIYCTGLVAGSVIPPQVVIGGRMAEILYFGEAPGWPGLNQVNVRVPSRVAPGPAVPVRLSYLGRPSNEVTIAVE